MNEDSWLSEVRSAEDALRTAVERADELVHEAVRGLPEPDRVADSDQGRSDPRPDEPTILDDAW